jgi:hypothetical protein
MLRRVSAVASLLILSACAASSTRPRPPVPQPPPAAPTYTLIVHVCDGSCSADRKVHVAALVIGDRQVPTDDAGNAEFSALPSGHLYEVCADAEGFQHGCASATLTVPNQELNLELVRLVPPTLPVRVDGRFWVTDAGTFRPLFQSGLTLLVRGPPERAAFLDVTRALGFNGVRVFAGDIGWAGQTPAAARAALPALLEEAAASGSTSTSARSRAAATTWKGTCARSPRSSRRTRTPSWKSRTRSAIRHRATSGRIRRGSSSSLGASFLPACSGRSARPSVPTSRRQRAPIRRTAARSTTRISTAAAISTTRSEDSARSPA